ncbi:MAG TPA: hypothetical protein VLZ89_03330 [Anaerolineales bacterium]|nr:hypothetical protein [Anaerolineales bacterium]
MNARKLVLAGLAWISACSIFLLAALTLSSGGQAERIITLILSAEILTPALILGFALAIYFASRSHKWRYR